MKDIKLTNMTDDQVGILEREAKKIGLPITGLIKHWCQLKLAEEAKEKERKGGSK